MIVFSHLRWNFVYQRPQHLMSRLAKHYRVIFFEEPQYSQGPARLEISEPAPDLIVCCPHTSVEAPGFHDDQLPVLRKLLDELVLEQRITDAIAWLYTPMALPLAESVAPRAIVYDCMDELSAFLNAPRQLLQRESALLKAADVVFTGGPSLYRSKKLRHDKVYCFPSSVEQAHFAQARDPAIEHTEQGSLPRPRLGFFGVIDERLDLKLIERLADERPSWQIVMVGPVAKIDRDVLPVRPNIHYYGQRDYAELPKFLAGWDVCLLPFAINAATKFISPTKTLEYMAAGKPIVSSPVTDVVEPYKGLVYEGASAAAFIRSCGKALALTPEALAALADRMSVTVSKTSWDSTAEKMREILQTITSSSPVVRPSLPRVSVTPEQRPVVIIGAGPTGLSAAYHVGEDSVLLEQNETVGGWCRSITDRGYTFDYAGHIMFSKDPYVHELYNMLLGDNVHWQDREAWIYSKGVYTRYPFQGALYGLPADVLKDCLIGAIEARFGPLQGGAKANSCAANSGSSPSGGKAESITDCCADGTVDDAQLSTQAAQAPRPPASRNFAEFIHSVWGSGVARHFAVPYNQKLWAVPLEEMEVSWLGGRVPMPDLEEMIDGALRPVAKPMGPNARFGYPLKGGFQALMNGFLPHLRGGLELNARVTRIIPSEHEVVLASGKTYRYEELISTMPLPVLIRLTGDEAPENVRTAAKALRHVSVRCVNLGIARTKVTEKHWIYYPEDSVFHRIFVQGNASPHVNPPGGFALTCEITYSPHKPLPCDGEALIQRCIEDCIKVGLLRADDKIAASNQVDMPYAYVVYDHARSTNVGIIRNWLTSQDIHLAGRYSEWEYYNSDHAFLAGKRAAELALARLNERDEIQSVRESGHGAERVSQGT